MRIAISTAWNAIYHTSGSAMIRELRDLGFDAFELNVHVTPEMAEEIAPMVQDGDIRISSLHNYFPLPPGIDLNQAAMNVLPISSLDPDEHAAAIGRASQTIEWAEKFGAPAVVMHTGIVPMKWRLRDAVALIKEGRRDEAREIVEQDLRERSAIRGPYLDSVIAGLRELSKHAEDAGVRLGIETRYHYVEIPQLDEFGAIFEGVDSPAVGYWHDAGHAQVMEYLGIATQEDYLDRYGDRLVGMHIHDCADAHDHQPIGGGAIDFRKILSYARPDTQLVFEMHGRNASGEDLVRSRETILRILESG